MDKTTTKPIPMKAGTQYEIPNQQLANTTYKSDDQCTTASDPRSTSAKQLIEMTAWLAGIGKRKMMLEAWQRELTKWNVGLDQWQAKIPVIKVELEESDREVRELRFQKRAGEEWLRMATGEVSKLRRELSRSQARMGDNSGEDVDKLEVISDYQLILLPPGFKDMQE